MENVIASRYLTTKGAATYLGLSVFSIYRLVDRRAIPFVPIRPSAGSLAGAGRASLRFDTRELDQWMHRQTVAPVEDSIDAARPKL